jgi:hypothetical protein
MTEDQCHPSKEVEKEEKVSSAKDELPAGVIFVETAKSSSTDTDTAAADVLSISTRACLDMNRWQSDGRQMPSLEKFTKLQQLELDKDRYLHHLHESVTGLRGLQSLLLTRCSRLQSLPQTIGQLGNLQVVSTLYIYRIVTSFRWMHI